MDTMRSSLIKWQIQQSMGEELSAGSVYMDRALTAEQGGDTLTAEVYRELAKDELYDHYPILNERLSDLATETGGEATMPFWLHKPQSLPMKINTPRFNVGDTVVYRYMGVDATGEILKVGEFKRYIGFMYEVSHPSMGTGNSEWVSERSLRLVNCSCDKPQPQSVAYECQYKGAACKSGDLAKAGDNIFDVKTNQRGVLRDITGDARYGTILMVEMTEPSYYTLTKADGTTEQKVLYPAGPRAYTPNEWKHAIVRDDTTTTLI